MTWARRLRQVFGWLLVVAAGVGIYLYYLHTVREREGQPKFKTVKVDRGGLAAKVTATGTLSARTTVVVGSQVSGRISDLSADYNSTVKKGQVLAKIDPRLFEAALLRAQANFASSQAAVTKAQANYDQAKKARDRLLQLRESGLAGQADIDQAETTVATSFADIAVAKASLQQATASLEEARVNLGFTTIVSPIDGVVLSRSVDVGQTVAASLQAPTLFTIAQDLRSIQVDTYISEADVGKLRAAMPATFTVDAFPGRRFEGVVREVRNAPQTVQNVVTYDAVLDVRNDALELRPGMTATVTFIWAERDSVTRIPNAALRFRAPENFGTTGSHGSSSAGSSRSGRRAASEAAAAGSASEGISTKSDIAAAGAANPAPSGSAPGASSAGARAGDGGRPTEPNQRMVWSVVNVPGADGKTVATPRSHLITIGITDGSYTEVVAGHLNPGDDVITDLIQDASTTTTTGNSPFGGATRAPGGGGGGGGGGARRGQ